METVESSYDTRENMTTEMILDFLGIALDKSALADEDIKVNLSVTDTGEQFLLRFKNGPLLHFEGMQDNNAALTLEGPRQALLPLMTGSPDAISQAMRVTGGIGAARQAVPRVHRARRRRQVQHHRAVTELPVSARQTRTQTGWRLDNATLSGGITARQ